MKRSRISTSYLIAEENEGPDTSVRGMGGEYLKGLASNGFIIELHVNFVFHSENNLLVLVFHGQLDSHLYSIQKYSHCLTCNCVCALCTLSHISIFVPSFERVKLVLDGWLCYFPVRFIGCCCNPPGGSLLLVW